MDACIMLFYLQVAIVKPDLQKDFTKIICAWDENSRFKHSNSTFNVIYAVCMIAHGKIKGQQLCYKSHVKMAVTQLCLTTIIKCEQ